MNRSIVVALLGCALVLSSCGLFGGDDDGDSALPPGPATDQLGTNAAIDGNQAQIDKLVAVVGIPRGEGLPVAVLPGSDNIIGELPAGSADTYYIGETTTTDDGQVWWWVRRDRLQGWVKPGVAFPGEKLNITSQVRSLFDGANPEAAAADALVISIANTLSPEGGDPIIGAESVPDEQLDRIVTVDVIGDPDPAIAGTRYHVTVQQNQNGFSMQRVDRTYLCATAEADGDCL